MKGLITSFLLYGWLSVVYLWCIVARIRWCRLVLRSNGWSVGTPLLWHNGNKEDQWVGYTKLIFWMSGRVNYVSWAREVPKNELRREQAKGSGKQPYDVGFPTPTNTQHHSGVSLSHQRPVFMREAPTFMREAPLVLLPGWSDNLIG